MKKVVAIILPLTLSAAFISTAVAGPDTDYYVYAEKGAAAASLNHNDFNAISIQIGAGISATFPKEDGEPVATPMQIPVTISVGYSHTWSQFYLGGQLQFGYNFTPEKLSYTNDEGVLNYAPQWQSLATVQVGGVISDTNVVYIDGGYALGHFHYANATSTKSLSYFEGGPAVGMEHHYN